MPDAADRSFKSQHGCTAHRSILFYYGRAVCQAKYHKWMILLSLIIIDYHLKIVLVLPKFDLSSSSDILLISVLLY